MWGVAPRNSEGATPNPGVNPSNGCLEVSIHASDGADVLQFAGEMGARGGTVMVCPDADRFRPDGGIARAGQGCHGDLGRILHRSGGKTLPSRSRPDPEPPTPNDLHSKTIPPPRATAREPPRNHTDVSDPRNHSPTDSPRNHRPSDSPRDTVGLRDGIGRSAADGQDVYAHCRPLSA
jgi:hypothetical protein